MICLRRSILSTALFVACLSQGASAFCAESFTVDLPVKSSLKLPVRLAAPPQQVSSPDGVGYTTFSILPAAEEEALFITVVFKEEGKKKEEKSGPAVFWTNKETGQQTTLSENLAEGVTGLNQRTLAIPAALTGSEGQLVITGDPRDIRRVRLDWMPASPVYVAADQAPVAFLSADHLQAPTDLTGSAQAGLPDTWFGTVLDAPLQESAEEVQGSVEFDVPLAALASQVLFKVKVLGLPLEQSLRVWINGKAAGTLQPAIPPLVDPGYLSQDNGEFSYAGWRFGAVLLPAGLLKEGDNAIQVESPTSGVFLRDATLQLRSSGTNSSATAESIPLPAGPVAGN